MQRLVSNYSYNTGQSAPVCSKSHRANSRLACASLGGNFGGGGGTPSREECSRAMAAPSPKSSPNSHKCIVPNFGRYSDVPYSLIYQWQPTPERSGKFASSSIEGTASYTDFLRVSSRVRSPSRIT